MRRLRTKLFLSIGSILLAVAVLSYAIPVIFIDKDINKAASYLSDTYNAMLKKMHDLSTTWIVYRFVQTAAQLDAVAGAIHGGENGIWENAAAVLDQDPEIAIVQITSADGKTAVISAGSAELYVPLWAHDSKGRLWIQFPSAHETLLAKSLPSERKYYLLFTDPEADALSKSLTFQPFQQDAPPKSSSKNPEGLYETLSWKEHSLLEKISLIQKLAVWEGKAAGILQVDSAFKEGVALLADDIFSSEPIVDPDELKQTPLILYQKQGPSVNLVQLAKKNALSSIVIGFSLSTIAEEIGSIIEKPVLLYNKGTLLQGFSPLGESVPINEFIVFPKQIKWRGVAFFPVNVDIGPLTFSILIPQADKSAVFYFLNKIKQLLITKVSLILFSVAFVLFLIALLVLARISKRITKPVTQLAQASEAISNGKYDSLTLPPTEKRKDEIAVLTHSFEGMVVALRDREKTRAVLNKVVSKEIAAKILTSAIELGGEERKLTMLFSDIRGFTPLSETLPPHKLIYFLNTYMTRMCRIIDEKHGVVDKFVGDEIMALYGAPLDMKHHAEAAIESALLMLEDLKRWNQENMPNQPQIEIGIGIHTGVAFAGNMGAEDRLNYTVVGANVNLASRLCSVARPMQILISEATYQELADPQQFSIQPLSPVSLKGIDVPIMVYAVS